MDDVSCEHCKGRVHKARTPDGVCPACGTRTDFRCRGRARPDAPCKYHPGHQADEPLTEQIARMLGQGVPGGWSSRSAFWSALVATPNELVRLTAAWTLARAIEIQTASHTSHETRLRAIAEANRAAETLHKMALLEAAKDVQSAALAAATKAIDTSRLTDQELAALLRIVSPLDSGTGEEVARAQIDTTAGQVPSDDVRGADAPGR